MDAGFLSGLDFCRQGNPTDMRKIEIAWIGELDKPRLPRTPQPLLLILYARSGFPESAR